MLDVNGSYVFGYDKIKTVPASKIHDFALDETISDYQTNAKTYRCPQKSGLLSYILGTRLEPLKEYSVIIPAIFEDVYGNALGKDVSFQIKTGIIDPKDMYLYSSLSKPVQIIPNNLPIVMNFMSINITSANVEVCEMNSDGYKNYLTQGNNKYYTPECTRNIEKTINLKNHYWNLTSNKFDVEKDIIGANSTSPFILVRASTSTFNRNNGYMDNEREFLHVFVRSNLAMTLEDAKNTKILFAPSFDGKVLPDNLTFDTYVRNYTQNGVFWESKAFPIQWNASKKYYELTDPENKLSLVIAKNDQFF